MYKLLSTVSLLFVFLTLTTGQTAAPVSADTLAEKKADIRLFALPLVFYGPETRLGFGAAGVAAFNWRNALPTDRPSQVQLGFAYTLNRQVLIYLPYQFFSRGERWNFSGELGLYRYFYYYFGRGQTKPGATAETYDVDFPRIRFRGLNQLLEKQFFGLQYWMDDYRNLEFEEGGLLDTNRPSGIDGGTVSALGPIYILDSRDNVFAPFKGWYVEASALINAPWLGSDFQFTKYILDARKYLQLKEHSVLALQYYAEFTGGDAPFYNLALLGGNKRLRGYIEGQLRDNHYMMFQAEWRQHLFWRIGMTAFAGFGGVAEELNGFDIRNSVWAVGLGLRVLLLKEDRINVRVDYGIGQQTSGFYVTVTEAF